jgi:hypothetical protein
MREPQRFRKKPVVIEAMLLGTGNVADVAEWCGGKRGLHSGVVINTLEGVMKADIGDYVIRGVQGEFYPCKPDIFAATYEAAQ